jgi:hypothetical protein
MVHTGAHTGCTQQETKTSKRLSYYVHQRLAAQKKSHSSAYVNRELNRSGVRPGQGVMFMGHCILVQLAQHSHWSGGCFAAVALLSRSVRDRAAGTARRGPRIRCITTTSNRRFRSRRKLCRSIGISEDVHALHGCDLEEVLRAQTVCFLHQANVFAILLGHTPNIAMSAAHPQRVSRAPPRGHCSTAYAADSAISKHVVLLQDSSHRSKGCLHFQALLAQNLNSQGMGGSLHGTTSNFRWHPFGRSRQAPIVKPVLQFETKWLVRDHNEIAVHGWV